MKARQWLWIIVLAVISQGIWFATCFGKDYILTAQQSCDEDVCYGDWVVDVDVSSDLAPTFTPKTVTFVGGGVSGGITWQQSYDLRIDVNDYSTWTSGGGAPASAYIEVHTSGKKTEVTKVALPLTVPVTIPNVTRIYLYVGVPRVGNTSSWGIETAATVIYRVNVPDYSPIIIGR